MIFLKSFTLLSVCLSCALLPQVNSKSKHAWDIEEEFFKMEHPTNVENENFDLAAEYEARQLFVMSTRAQEVTKHRDIINPDNENTRAMDFEKGKWTGGSPRVFNDNGACGVADEDVPCCNQTCSGLNYCSALNGQRIEDKYFPTLPFIQGSCENFDERAARLDVWGDFHSNKPFRDTEDCRRLVRDYTCLWWSTMFQDRCFNETNAPRKPCRSFCVDVGLECANDPFDWVNLCHNIECPMKAGKCTRSSLNKTQYKEGEFDYDGNAKDCWVIKVPSAYSAAVSSPAPFSSIATALLATAFTSVVLVKTAYASMP